MIRYSIFLYSLLNAVSSFSQTLKMMESSTQSSFRGMSVCANSIWVSGSAGTVGHSKDQGKTWKMQTVKGFEKVDFRDIQPLNESTILIMGIASPAYILKTTDAGNTWKKVYENKDTAMFLDAMAFINNKKGIVIGDPIGDKIFIAETRDGGNSWTETSRLQLPQAISGEAFFAASGTNILLQGSKYYLVSGGRVSRFFTNHDVKTLPTMQGEQMTGANSIAVSGKTIWIASGDYTRQNRTDSAFVYSNDGGKTWKRPSVPPGGYRSCVCAVSEKIAVTCGITGVDISYDGGMTWKNISTESFNTCAYSKRENTVYLAGNKGKLAKLNF